MTAMNESIMKIDRRGRLRGGEWVDQQTSWEAGVDEYTAMFEIASASVQALMLTNEFVFVD